MPDGYEVIYRPGRKHSCVLKHIMSDEPVGSQAKCNTCGQIYRSVEGGPGPNVWAPTCLRVVNL